MRTDHTKKDMGWGVINMMRIKSILHLTSYKVVDQLAWKSVIYPNKLSYCIGVHIKTPNHVLHVTRSIMVFYYYYKNIDTRLRPKECKYQI